MTDTTTGAKPVTLHCELSESDAFALAELCKRLTWHDCRELATNEAECRHMLSASVRVRQALQLSGVFVR